MSDNDNPLPEGIRKKIEQMAVDAAHRINREEELKKSGKSMEFDSVEEGIKSLIRRKNAGDPEAKKALDEMWALAFKGKKIQKLFQNGDFEISEDKTQ